MCFQADGSLAAECRPRRCISTDTIWDPESCKNVLSSYHVMFIVVVQASVTTLEMWVPVLQGRDSTRIYLVVGSVAAGRDTRSGQRLENVTRWGGEDPV